MSIKQTQLVHFITLNHAQSYQLGMYCVVFFFLGAGLFEAIINSHNETGISGIDGSVISLVVYLQL